MITPNKKHRWEFFYGIIIGKSYNIDNIIKCHTAFCCKEGAKSNPCGKMVMCIVAFCDINAFLSNFLEGDLFL